MKSWKHLVVPSIVAVCIIGGVLIAGGQVRPSPQYLQDDVKYFPAGPEACATEIGKDVRQDDVMGKLLFENVTTVWFAGPGWPFGGLTSEEGATIAVYEHFVVRDLSDPDGVVYRTLYPYKSLGRIEQQLPQKPDKQLRRTRR